MLFLLFFNKVDEEGGDASDDEHNLKQRFYNRIMEELCQYSSSSESGTTHNVHFLKSYSKPKQTMNLK